MDLTEIGYFSKTHGIKGHLILKSEIDFYFENLNAFFIDIAGNKSPHFIEEINENTKGFIVLVESIDTVDKAKLFVGKKVFIDSKFVPQQKENLDLVDYELIDKNFGSLGKIVEVSDNGVQMLITVNYKDKEIILPLIDDFIEGIDEATKQVRYNAPEGLIEVYLSNN